MRLPALQCLIQAGGGIGFRLPTDALQILPRAIRRQIGDADEMHPGRSRHLRYVHCAELPGADDTDAQRLALSCALLEFGIEIHINPKTRDRPRFFDMRKMVVCPWLVVMPL